MFSRSLLSVALLSAMAGQAFADVDIVIDDFESYADATALQAAWVSQTGSTTSTFLTNPPDSVYRNYDGQAAVFDGSIGVGAGTVNEWATPFSQTVEPTATQNVELTVDLGHDALTGNKKLSLGLRGPAGIIELGFWNQAPVAPADQFAFRNILFASGDTNWEAFNLNPLLNSVFEIGNFFDDNDVSAPEPDGSAFHRFKAVISETDVTFSLDLFADGLDNRASLGADYNNDGIIDGDDLLFAQRNDLDIPLWEATYGGLPGPPVAGVDAINVVPAVADVGGFDSLRFGIPSSAGSSADAFLAIDNVSLRLVDIPLAQVATVPEPGTALLSLLALAGLGVARRR